MDTKRLILFVIFSFSLMLLWDSFQKQNIPVEQPVSVDLSLPEPSNALIGSDDLPKSSNQFVLGSGESIDVNTDLLKLTINTFGGDIRQLNFKKHLDKDSKKNYELMTDISSSSNKFLFYVAQSGLLGTNLPTHKSLFQVDKKSYQMSSSKLIVPLVFENEDVIVKKTYEFNEGSYLIKTIFEIQNKTNNILKPSAYYQFVHDGKSGEATAMMPTFTGPAFFTDKDKFDKLDFSDVNKKSFSKITDSGWIGIIQRYFAATWILPPDISREFYTKKIADNIYSVGVLTKLRDIPGGQNTIFSTTLFAGPQAKEELNKAAPGMNYVVDYGILHFIASPLFSVLIGIHKMVGNWGISIILLTFLIKLLFYPLSAASYKSMGQMRELAPRLQSMKEKFGDDKQKMQQAMMELYKTEKINPLGGCLPILVQIPVFIALYWVLLGSVELRGAPFMWLTDLSKPDMLFGKLWFLPLGPLPILMAASMFLQTKLNPKPTDPLQARLMIMMPVIFSFFFFFFPAGLVLYWLVNNILSIAQQWHVNNKIHAEALKKKGNA
ncbi:MAG: membrane protein insertase YidC [Nitrosomonadales bacterium]|nr:membrane protein insertase YidC [Nitrosomonadales bacterium]|tara:strand:- start:838 stop:2487 length:1650 start_codon:yes stop_codon:yes gene_type:complete